MKYILLLFFTVFFFSVFSFAQNELVIEVTTDNYPNENRWVLYDIENNVIKESGTLLKETTQRDTIELSSASCYYWTIYDSYGDGMSSNAGGDYKLYLDGILIASCANPNFGDSVSVYNLGEACSFNDIKVNKITNYDYVSKDLDSIRISVLNMGREPISSIEMTYSVNRFSSNAITIDNLFIPVGANGNITLPEPYNFDTPGTDTISVNVSKVNGTDDSNALNNIASKVVTVLDGFLLKNIIEDFSSYECPYCYDASAQIDATLHDFPGSCNLVQYMCWDFADVKYFEGLEPLLNYYGVMGLPHTRLNGGSFNYSVFTSTYYLDYVGLTTPIKLTVSGQMKGDSLSVQVNVFSNQTINDKLTLRGVVLENQCFDVSKRFVNSDPFYNVAYDLINGANGFELDGIQANETKTFTSAVSITGYPFEEGSFSDMQVLFYLQNYSSREVLQSIKYPLSYIEIPLAVNFNLENNATGVDTTGLAIKFSSNRLLKNADGSIITDIVSHLQFKKDNENGANVPFKATLNARNDSILMKPQYGWQVNTKYFVTIKDFATIDGYRLTEDKLSFTTREYVGISEQSNDIISLYPNPAKDKITIKSTQPVQIKILTVTGNILKEMGFSGGAYQIDVSSLQSGYYFIHSTVGCQKQVVGFLKQ